MKWASLALLMLLACLAARPVYANCSNPAGKEADAIYNGDYHTYQFCNGTAWIPFGIQAGGLGSMQLISTQTASSSASLQWTGLGSYNTYLLSCGGLQPVTNAVDLDLQFGEGATPTWKTSGYAYGAMDAGGGAFEYHSSGAAAILLNWPTVAGNQAYQAQASTVWIHNLSNTSTYKFISFHTTYYEYNASSVILDDNGGGYYSGDTNAVTAIRLQYSSGNIAAGQCSLYGMN
jgi:hypothetical protein